MRHLNLHGCLHDDSSGLIVLGNGLTLIRSTGLTATSAEYGTEIAAFIYIDGESIIITLLGQCITEACGLGLFLLTLYLLAASGLGLYAANHTYIVDCEAGCNAHNSYGRYGILI